MHQSAIVLHAPRPPAWPEARRREWLERLPYARRIALERRSPADCTASLAALGLLELALARWPGWLPGRSPWPELCFDFEAKPRLADGPDFSLSHSATRLACALACAGVVGIDVEEVGPGRTSERLRDWTAREAVLKADGTGLRGWREVVLQAGRAEFRGQGYWLRALDFGAGCVAHIAASRPLEGLVVHAVAPP